jgi:predicted nucleic-acid-binding protein
VKAVDTNILARLFVDDPDDPEAVRQRPKATRVMSGEVFVSTTVLLEFEWVLRGFYQLAPRQIGAVLSALCGLANVSLEDRDAVLSALEWHQRGMDLADALHLARSTQCEAFVTFDKSLAKRAASARAMPRVELER